MCIFSETQFDALYKIAQEARSAKKHQMILDGVALQHDPKACAMAAVKAVAEAAADIVATELESNFKTRIDSFMPKAHAIDKRINELEKMLEYANVPRCSNCYQMKPTERVGQLHFCSDCRTA